jgi:hypothetical protein
MQIGDMIRHHGNSKFIGLVIGKESASIMHVLWAPSGKVERISQRYLELVSESR